MRLRWTVICVAFGALACGGGRSPADSGDDERGGLFGGSGDDTDVVGVDDSVGDDTSSGGGWLSDCPRYSGFSEGARWVWEYSDDYVDEIGHYATWTSEVVLVDGSKVVLDYVGEIEHPSYDYYTYEGSSTYRCEDGLFMLKSETRTDYSTSGNAAWVESRTSYDDPWQLLSADPRVGDSWSQDISGTSTSSTSTGQNNSSDFGYTVSYVIEEGGDVTTPAGTFNDTLAIHQTTDGNASESWADKHAGSVYIGEYAQLVSWSD